MRNACISRTSPLKGLRYYWTVCHSKRTQIFRIVNHLPILSKRSGDVSVPSSIVWVCIMLIDMFCNIWWWLSAWLPQRTAVHSSFDKIALFKSIRISSFAIKFWIVASFASNLYQPTVSIICRDNSYCCTERVFISVKYTKQHLTPLHVSHFMAFLQSHKQLLI